MENVTALGNGGRDTSFSTAGEAGKGRSPLAQTLRDWSKMYACGSANFFGGLAILFFLWWLSIYLITLDPSKSLFEEFGLFQAFGVLPELWEDNTIPHALATSGYRLAMGLLIAIGIGVPVGIVMGRVPWFKKLSNVPFQFLRMVSPLSWEPIAVIVFLDWDSAIVFLIAIASVWPVVFSTAAGLEKVDPNWFKVARNLGANQWDVLTKIILPAIAFDVFGLDRPYTCGVSGSDLRVWLRHPGRPRIDAVPEPDGDDPCDRCSRVRVGQHTGNSYQQVRMVQALIGTETCGAAAEGRDRAGRHLEDLMNQVGE